MDQTVKDQAFVLKALLAAAHVVTSVAAVDAMSRAGGFRFDYGRLASCALAMSQISMVSIWIVVGQTRPLFRWGALFGLFAFWLPQLWRDLDDNYVLLNNLIWQAGLLILAMLILQACGLRMINVRDGAAHMAALLPRQFPLGQLFLVTTVVAACIGVARYVDFSGSRWRSALILGLANAATAAPIFWAIFSTQRLQLRVAMLLVALSLCGGAVWLGMRWWEPIVSLYGLYCLLLAASLWVFRLCGCRLIRMPAPPAYLASTVRIVT